MAEFRAIRLICEHFGVSGPYVDDNLEYGLFWCYLAESLDAEELRDYRDALLAGGKDAKKKWKWATPDHAGTKPVAIGGQKNVKQSIVRFATMLSGGPLKASGNIEEYAKVRNMPLVYQDADGDLFDEHGKPIPSRPGQVFVPLKEGKPN